MIPRRPQIGSRRAVSIAGQHEAAAKMLGELARPLDAVMSTRRPRDVGVSPDGEASRSKFKNTYGLPFTLLSNPDQELTERYGFWKQKTFRGKTYMGVERSTVVIDADGTLKKVFRRVKPEDHAQVLRALDENAS